MRWDPYVLRAGESFDSLCDTRLKGGFANCCSFWVRWFRLASGVTAAEEDYENGRTDRPAPCLVAQLSVANPIANYEPDAVHENVERFEKTVWSDGHYVS